MTNPTMICDLGTGVCGPANDEEMEIIQFDHVKKSIELYYVTDPICSHCWALEPVLRRFLEQYKYHFNVHTVMGGLLKGWEGFADTANGISAPSNVASHWREVGEHSRMPIDGSLWYDNPVQSSYPPSRVFKLIQGDDEQLAATFLRRAREAVFAFNRNIGDDQVLMDIVDQLGLNGKKIVGEANSPIGQQLLDQDFALSRKLGVRGFPTIIMVNEENKGVKIVGARSLDHYVKGLQQLLPLDEELQSQPLSELRQLLDAEKLLFSKEIEAMYDLEQAEIESFIQKNLSPTEYELNHLLGEMYIEKKLNKGE
ncbi:dithiol-disulfide isomerase [Bacillus sp. FJAT-27231]|uniref:DsbA family oxidoreductase n=1 Tax=Bacillus sp. FJAT-27231 TaxID=1679168 RepID=UPI00067090B6|nr:DsbA family protein [Bacillus sp. FJAT-27231]KMY55276.1 dithiol-disulfide isomerase [Bacillus sp. FJAT-27231]